MVEFGRRSGDGAVSLEEFIEAMATVPGLQHAADVYKWRQTFNEFDEDGSGFLDSDELKQMATRLWLPEVSPQSHTIDGRQSRSPSPSKRSMHSEGGDGTGNPHHNLISEDHR